MKFAITVSALSLVLSGGAAFAQTSSNCTVVDLKPGESAPSNLSTSITAGNGQVSGSTTAGGHTVTSTSGAGGTGSYATSSASNGNSTTVTDSNGHCTVYRKAEDKK